MTAGGRKVHFSRRVPFNCGHSPNVKKNWLVLLFLPLLACSQQVVWVVVCCVVAGIAVVVVSGGWNVAFTHANPLPSGRATASRA